MYIYIIYGIPIFLIFIIFIAYVSVQWRNKCGQSEITFIKAIQDQLLIVSKVYHHAEDGGFYYTKISTLDRKNGRVLQFYSIYGELLVIGITDDVVWLYDKVLYGYNFHTKHIIFKSNALPSTISEISHFELLDAVFIEQKYSILLKYSNGHHYFLDCRSLQIIKLIENKVHNVNKKSLECQTKINNLPRHKFHFESNTYCSCFMLKYNHTHILPTLTFIDPKILWNSDFGQSAPQESEVIFMHYGNWTESAPFFISKVNGAGEHYWNLSSTLMGVHSKLKSLCINTIMFDNDLLLVLQNEKNILVAIETIKGELNWSTSKF